MSTRPSPPIMDRGKVIVTASCGGKKKRLDRVFSPEQNYMQLALTGKSLQSPIIPLGDVTKYDTAIEETYKLLCREDGPRITGMLVSWDYGMRYYRASGKAFVSNGKKDVYGMAFFGFDKLSLIYGDSDFADAYAANPNVTQLRYSFDDKSRGALATGETRPPEPNGWTLARLLERSFGKQQKLPSRMHFTLYTREHDFESMIELVVSKRYGIEFIL